MSKVMTILERETSGKSYRSIKYQLDPDTRSVVNHGEANGQWQKTAETIRQRGYIDLRRVLENKGFAEGPSILKFFLDGSRRVFKVDDMAYLHARDRSVLYPIIAGQIGVGCLARVDRRMSLERYVGEMVIAAPGSQTPMDGRGSSRAWFARSTRVQKCKGRIVPSARYSRTKQRKPPEMTT